MGENIFQYLHGKSKSNGAEKEEETFGHNCCQTHLDPHLHEPPEIKKKKMEEEDWVVQQLKWYSSTQEGSAFWGSEEEKSITEKRHN